MALFSAFSRARQHELHAPRDIKQLPSTGSWVMFILAATAACALVFSAAAQNVAHAYSLGLASSLPRAYVLAAASLGASILGPCAWVAVFGRGTRFGTRAVSLMLAVGCLTYAGTCSLGLLAGARNEAVLGRVIVSDAYRDARAIRDAARDELASLKGQGPTVLKRRRELTAILTNRDAVGTLQRAAAPTQIDPQAAALGFYLRAAGLGVRDEAVATWLMLGMVLFLELAAALSFTVAAALRPARGAMAPAAPTEGQGGQMGDFGRGYNKRKPPDQPPKPKGKGGRPASAPSASVLTKLRKAGGQVNGSISDVGRSLGIRSKSTAHRVLRRLVAAGEITMQANRSGCRVALA
jgi:hypothetical protein